MLISAAFCICRPTRLRGRSALSTRRELESQARVKHPLLLPTSSSNFSALQQSRRKPHQELIPQQAFSSTIIMTSLPDACRPCRPGWQFLESVHHSNGSCDVKCVPISSVTAEMVKLGSPMLLGLAVGLALGLFSTLR